MQGWLASFQQHPVKLPENEEFVRLTLCDVPSSLLREFAVKVVRPYYSGLVEAFEDLMRKAIERQKQEEGRSSEV